MKCRSVACIWSGSPPPHKVTATAVLNQPPTLYTGGADGSIIWWTFSGNDSNPEIKPMALLCGHAAPIADLGICYPVANSKDGDIGTISNLGVNSATAECGALISACTDGVLCVWSRGSGHCRRRRKLPPWVGSPSTIRTLPSNSRYACIACCVDDAAHLFGHQPMDLIEGVEPVLNEEAQHKKPPKCTLVVVDTYSLSIVQTVFHGNLSIGPLRFMSVVALEEDREHDTAIMIDSFGNSQLVPISKDCKVDGEGGAGFQRSSSHSQITLREDGLTEFGNIVTVATSKQFFAFVYRTCCIFRSIDSGAKIGEISFSDNSLNLDDDYRESDIIGGTFLESAESTLISQHSKMLAIWNDRGSAVVYLVSCMDNIINASPLFGIPAACCPHDMGLTITFLKLNSLILRVESVNFHVKESSFWGPHVMSWSLNMQVDDHLKLLQQGKLLGEGTGAFPREIDPLPQQSSPIICNNVNNIQAVTVGCGLGQTKQTVSSSMVISGIFGIPYAVVYGFYSGEIELLQFDMFPLRPSSGSGSPYLQVEPTVSKRRFCGHAGAVLCLAKHEMLGISTGWSFTKVLVSGGMDCTVHIWDLESSNLIRVLHQHVAPVRQIIFPPVKTERPWSDCFLSVGEDCCVALVSLETLRVERMFPGHPNYPAKVVWDGARGYIACISRNYSKTSETVDVLYIWDIKTGARERVLRGTGAHSMFDHLYRSINQYSAVGNALTRNTSASSLLFPVMEDPSLNNTEKGPTASNKVPSITKTTDPNLSRTHPTKGNSSQPFPCNQSALQNDHHIIKCSCPFPGIATLCFDLASLMSFFEKHETVVSSGYRPDSSPVNEQSFPSKEESRETSSPCVKDSNGGSCSDGISVDAIEEQDWVRLLEESLLRFSLSFLHLWEVDIELDKLLITDMNLKKPDAFTVTSGLQGDRGSLTVTFPGLGDTLELWKSSSEFSAIRSLIMVSLAQRMISFSHSTSTASSALAAFYTRHFAEKIPDIKPLCLQLLVSFWQDKSEHVRMAARSLFHCAASRAIPLPLCSPKAFKHANFMSFTKGIEEFEKDNKNEEEAFSDMRPSSEVSEVEESRIVSWLESYEEQDWISCVEGTSQDAMTSHIIVAAALSIWYPSIVKPSLSMLTVHPLMKLVMAMNEKYSCTAVELLAEGMESTWKVGIGPEIPRLISDIFFQIECVSGGSSNLASQSSAASDTIRDTLVSILLPNLAMADIPGFLSVIESQIWSTASDSPVHLVSLMTLIRVVRGSPKCLAQCIDKVVNFILQTMDPGNSVMRRTCLQSAIAALKEVVRVFPMIALNDSSTRLAVGDAIGETKTATIRVYDMQSLTKVKVLDASGPPGLPSLLAVAAEAVLTTVISALSFSPDGEGLVAFSEQGLMIRWWSLGSVWWEKLSRNLVPVQCTKLIFVPPWEGFSPNSSRSSVFESIAGNYRQANSQVNARDSFTVMDSLKVVIQNLDLSYKLEWLGNRKVLLTRHGHDLGTFPL